MKEAEIYSTSAANECGFVWRWRDCNGAAQSNDAFDMYHDCASDARRRGYTVRASVARGDTAPQGPGFRLDGSTDKRGTG